MRLFLETGGGVSVALVKGLLSSIRPTWPQFKAVLSSTRAGAEPSR
jgi:hypothetical protein